MTEPESWRVQIRSLAERARLQRPGPDDWERIVARSRSTQTLAPLERAVIDGALVTDTTLDAASNVWPSDYLEAFRRLGLDEKYGTETSAGLFGLFHHLSDAQIQGLVNSVKGTVLEIRVRDMAQAGELPGLEALPADVYLSKSLTQQGHDVEVVDSSGEIIERIQVKAGDWSGISPRVDEYAAQGIPIAVTSEAAVRADTAGHGAAVFDTGISGVELTSQTVEIVDGLGISHAVDQLVPEMAIVAVVAAAGIRLRSGQSPQQVRYWLVTELQDLGIANAGSLAVEVLTGVVVFRPVTALAAKWGMARLRTARATSATLSQLRETLHDELSPINGASGA